MMIAIGSKWQHKDGGVYEILDNTVVICIDKGNGVEPIKGVDYKDQDREIYVRTKSHFLDSFKPYEPVKQEFIVIKHANGRIWEGWLKFNEDFAKLKEPMMYKITVEEIF